MNRWLAATFSIFLLLPAASASAERIATIPNASPVREHAGITAWTQRDDKGYHLVVRRQGLKPRILPAGTSATPFVFDIGSDTRGEPQVVYERDGDLYAFSLARTTGERAVRNANTTDARETTPTLWRGRLAFTRIRGDDPPVVYTKTMTAPRSLPSRRLPGVPSRGGTTSRRTVETLELYGRNLAQVVSYVGREQTGHSESEVRLVDLRGGVRQVARMSTGEGGQTFIGPSFRGSRIYWVLTCLGDPSGCEYGAQRARLSDLAVERTRQGQGLDGFAVVTATTGEQFVVVDSVGSKEAGKNLPGLLFAVETRTFGGWTATARRR